MSAGRTFTFVVAVNNREVLERNVLASPCLRRQHPQHQVLLRENFKSASSAYNSALALVENLRNFHLYGPDICLAALTRGMRSYAISAFCIHNAQLNLILPPDFYASYKQFKRSWISELPVQTTCIRVTKFNINMRIRQL